MQDNLALLELDQLKVTEFQQFLLYTGLVVLREVLSKPQYEHFLTLSIAVRILCPEDEEKRVNYVNYVGELLNFFVFTAKEYYGELFAVFFIIIVFFYKYSVFFIIHR